jgi:acetate kinase
MRTLVVNAGSTNVKLSVLDGEVERFATTVEHQAPAAAVASGLDQVRAAGLLPVEAVGHRVVHGGPDFTAGVRITDGVVAKLTALNDLAPLHNPPALEALAEARRQLPDVPHVAAFDTAFHQTIPGFARTYPVPRKWTDEWGIRKYGFHGLSHEYCARRAVESIIGPANDTILRVVVAHLGGGCSLSAVAAGSCFDTTMGFTPLDGLMMATRSGSIDPGAILYVMRKHGLTVDQMEHVLNYESGLLGVSGVSGDIREVRKAANEGSREASLAFHMFTYRVRLGIGAMAAALGGLHALVFTGGIGEHSRRTRDEVCRHLDFLGVKIDPELNNTCVPDMDISAADAKVRVLVIHTREDVSIVREVQRVVKGS